MKLFLYALTTLLFLSQSALASVAVEKNHSTKKINQTRLASLNTKAIQNFDYANEFGVLSANDIKVYKQLFKAQRALKRPKVAKLIRKLENKSLLGHLMAVRLLHPKTKATYSDLRRWLNTYNDHHQAKTIYRLANKRKPKTARGHNKPIPIRGNIAKYTDVDDGLKQPKNKNIKYTSARTRTIAMVKKYIRNKKYRQAEKVLKSNQSRRLMGDSTYSKYALKLTTALYNNKRFSSAYRVSRRVGQLVKPMVYQAVWFEGLAAYHAKKYTAAANAFRRLANNVPSKSKYFSKASYWAALSYQKAGKKSMEQVYLKQASANPLDFYGLLAHDKLKKEIPLIWKQPKANKSEIKTLLKNKKIRRVIALAQIGEVDLAQKELRAVYAETPYGMDEALLKMTLDLKLAGNALTLSHNLLERNKMFLTGLYPDITQWKPKGASVDYSLINAIVKQESAFSPSVKSSAGAMGLMQIMPGTANHIRHLQGKRRLSKHYVFYPKVNINLGQYYLGYLLEEFNGNMIYAIAAYNAGPGNVKKWIDRGLAKRGPMSFVESIPFEETKKYVKKVMGNYWIYRAKFNQSMYNLHQLAKNNWPKDTYSLAFRFKR